MQDVDDPLCGISGEPGFITGNNILEELQLGVAIWANGASRTKTEDWPILDSLLTKSGAFPMLHRVSIEIWWYSVGRDRNKQDAILESLKEVKLPRLVESKAVEFNFSSEIQS